MCYDHYLEAAKENDLPHWITLLSQSQEPEVVAVRDIADILRQLHEFSRAEDQFRLVGVYPERDNPTLHIRASILVDVVATLDDIAWKCVTYSDGRKNIDLETKMFDIVVTALCSDAAAAKEWGCPKEVLDEFDSHS